MDIAPAGNRTDMDAFVVMGVSGAGKSTFGRALAERLGAPFIEADDLHSAANKAKMAAGTPLTDADRQPWLQAICADAVRRRTEAGRPVVIACSALKRAYRDTLRAGIGEVVFIHLAPGAEELRRRLAERRGHFMPASLLDSQLRTLEPLDGSERGMTLGSDEEIADGSGHPGDDPIGQVLARLAVGS